MGSGSTSPDSCHGPASTLRAAMIRVAMKALKRSDILGLSVAERIRLVEDIWDSIAEFPSAVSLNDAQKAELDRRLQAYRRTSGKGSPWSAVRKRLRKRS